MYADVTKILAPLNLDLRSESVVLEVADKYHEYGTICSARSEQLVSLSLGQKRHGCTEEHGEDDEDTNSIKCRGAPANGRQLVQSNHW